MLASVTVRGLNLQRAQADLRLLLFLPGKQLQFKYRHLARFATALLLH